MNVKRAIIAFTAAVLFVQSAHAEWLNDTQGIMGTDVSVTLWHNDVAQGRTAVDAVMAEMRRIDATLSPYKESSDLSILNRTAALAPQKLSDELALLIDKSLYISKISEGAFDITFASLGRYYDYRKHEKPSEKEIQETLPAINYNWLDFNKVERTLAYKHEKVLIDLGGIAKGYAIDRALNILRNMGIEHASVSAGGDSGLLGDRRGRPWIIGIKNPRAAKGANDAVIRLPLSNVALSTSGDYERYFIDENTGERIHHIINPRTGHSAGEVMSVSVLGDKGVDTDPLSTTVFILGVEKGLELINTLANFDAIIIDIHGKVHYSKGLAAGK